MGDFYPDIDTSREWWPGDPLPKGGPLKLDKENKQIKAADSSGHGTVESPKVYWQWQDDLDKLASAGNGKRDPSLYIKATENFVVEEARKLNVGITHIWIRKCGHDFKCTVNKSTGLRNKGKFELCDPHITVYLGRASHHANLLGHLYMARPLSSRFRTTPQPTWSVVSYRPMAAKDRTRPESAKGSKTWVGRNPELWVHDPNGNIAQEVRHLQLLAEDSWR